jgi:prepilin-type N-terminal cleavage/methylation domain-containing protein
MRQRSAGSVLRRRVDQAGFTLIEVVVGVVLLAVVAAGSAVLISVSNSMLTTSTSQSNTQAAIDSDISRARKLAEDYTCCPGSCTANAATIAAARTSGKCIGNANDSTYYFPQQTADVATFTSACASGTLTTNLITAIEALGNVSGVTRTMAVDDSSDPTTHRLRITYSGTNLRNSSIIRVVKLVPTAAAWCP